MGVNHPNSMGNTQELETITPKQEATLKRRSASPQNGGLTSA